MSFCDATTTSSKLGRYRLVPRITLEGLLLILVVTRLCTESFQMYKATRQWKTNQYINLLVREGVFYFIVYVAFFVFTVVPSVYKTQTKLVN